MKFPLAGLLTLFLLMIVQSGYGQSEPPGELANRETVMAFYQAAYNDKDVLASERFLSPELIQHHPEIGDGREGMETFIGNLRMERHQSHREIKRVLTDGDYVIVQGHYLANEGDTGAVTGDIFRLANGLIVEQWGIVHPITGTPDPDNANDIFGSNSAPYPVPTSTAQERRNLALATAFYNAALNEKDWQKASAYMGEYYQQHSIYMEDGRAGFEDLINRIKREFPNNLGLVKQSFADGDMVVLNLEVTRDKGGLAYNVIELMRLENDKVVEHWDIFQRLTDVVPVNSNGYW